MQVNESLLPLRKRLRTAKNGNCLLQPNNVKHEPFCRSESKDSTGEKRKCRPTSLETRQQSEMPKRPKACLLADFVDVLPDALCHIVFSKLEPRDLAGRCALVCKSWGKLARTEGLWKDFCTPWKLQESDTEQVLGGWRGLYATVLGTNLVQSPQFERLFAYDSSVSNSDEETRPFEARAKVVVERLCTAGEVECEYRSRSHWTDDMDYTAGNILPPVNTVYRTRFFSEQCDAESPQSSGSSHDAAGYWGDDRNRRPIDGAEVLRTDHGTWGRLMQHINLSAFPERFLDTCPPVQVSAFCCPLSEGRDLHGMVRLQLMLCDDIGVTLQHWDSGELEQKSAGWRTVAAVVQGYPKGVRSLVVKVSGKGALFTRMKVTFEPSSADFLLAGWGDF